MPSRTTTKEPKADTIDALLASITPGKPTPITKFEQLLKFYNAGGENELSGTTLYFYRRFPRIDTRITGNKNSNLEMINGVTDDKLVNTFPEDLASYITERYGGGRYQVMFNDKKRPVNGNSEQASTTVKIDELRFAPIIDPRQLVETDPETAGWITRQIQVGELARDQQGRIIPASQKQNSANQGSDAAQVAKIVADAVKESKSESAESHATRRSIDLVADTAQEQIKRMTPADPTSTVATLLAAMPKADSSVAAMVPMITAMMDQSTKMFMAMMSNQMELIKMQLTKRGDPEETTGGMAVAERIIQLLHRDKGPDWTDSLAKVAPYLLPMFMGMAGGRNGAPPPFGNPPPMMDTGAGQTPQTGIHQRQIEDFSQHALADLQREDSDGSEYAAAIDRFFGPAQYDALRAIGLDQLKAAMLKSPSAAQLQAFGQKFEKFMQEFFDYGDPAKAQASNGAPPPPPAADPNRPMGAV